MKTNKKTYVIGSILLAGQMILSAQLSVGSTNEEERDFSQLSQYEQKLQMEQEQLQFEETMTEEEMLSEHEQELLEEEVPLVLAKCKVQVPEMHIPPLPYKYDHKIYFPTGTWESWSRTASCGSPTARKRSSSSPAGNTWPPSSSRTASRKAPSWICQNPIPLPVPRLHLAQWPGRHCSEFRCHRSQPTGL